MSRTNMNKQEIIEKLIEVSNLIDVHEYEEDREIYEITWEQEAQQIIEEIVNEIKK